MHAYATAIDNLTIFTANKLKLENEELRRRLKEAPTIDFKDDAYKDRPEKP